MKKAKTLLMALSGWIGAYSAGAQTWANAMNAGGIYYQYGTGSARDNNGDRVVVGTYETGQAVFGTVNLPNAGGIEGFVTKYNQFNTLQWATRISGPGVNVAKSVVIGDNGFIYVCGFFTGTCTFYDNGGTVGTTLTTGNNTHQDGFLAKYDATGNVEWAKKVAFTAGYSADGILNLDFKNGTLAITGYVANTTSTGGYSLVAGSYVAKIDPVLGNTIWAYTSASGPGALSSVEKNGICVSNTGDIYVMQVAANNTTIYGNGTSSPITTTCAVSPFYARYNNAGNVIWYKTAGATGIGVQAKNGCVVIDDNDNLYISAVLYPTSSPSNANFTAIGGGTIPSPSGSSFIGRIDAVTGNAHWVKGQLGFGMPNLATQPCGLVYAAMQGSPGDVMYGTGGSSLTVSTLAMYVAKWHSSGQLLSTAANVWKINNTSEYAYLSSKQDHIDLAGAAYGTNTLSLTSGGSVTLTASAYDMLAATIIDLNPFPALSVSLAASPVQICAGDPTAMNLTVSGLGGPFTYDWSFYNNATGTYVPYTTGTTSLSLTAADYTPYVYFNPILNINIFIMQVTVTTCEGRTYTAIAFVVVHSPITYGGVTNQEICIGGGSPSAVFGVSAPGANAYNWEVSCDGGATWLLCSVANISTPGLYSNYNTASLTVNSPGLGMSGCQYRCILGAAFCPDDTTNPATLTVVEDCIKILLNGENDETTDMTLKTNLYPNPSGGLITLLAEGVDDFTPAQLYVRDMSGKLVWQQVMTTAKTGIDLRSLDNGVYLYSVQAGSRTHNGKLILAK